MILITDGQSNVGETSPKALAEKAGTKYLDGVRISTVGLGRDVSAEVLRRIADTGHGHYYFADKADTLTKIFREDLRTSMIPAARNIVLTLTPGAGFELGEIFGYEERANRSPDGTVVISFPDELNVDDWRILVAEVRGPKAPAGRRVPLTAELSYRNLDENGAPEEVAAKTPLEWHYASGPAPKVNRAVARNAIIFSDAVALKKVAELYADRKDAEASDVLAMQIASVRVARSWDDTESMQKEEETLLKARGIVERRLYPHRFYLVPPDRVAPRPDASGAKTIIETALDVARRVLPGPWSLIVSLLGLAVGVK
jgi:Ca-activated chloride channel family protein